MSFKSHIVIDERSPEGFRPDRKRCYGRHRLARFDKTVPCSHSDREVSLASELQPGEHPPSRHHEDDSLTGFVQKHPASRPETNEEPGWRDGLAGGFLRVASEQDLPLDDVEHLEDVQLEQNTR